MAEIAFDKLQLGLQAGTPAAVGSAVAATLIFPIDAGLIDPELDRGYESPDEDYGELARHQAGRGSYGIRASSVPITFVGRYEDVMRILEMRLAGGITPTGTDPYTWTYTADNASDTCKVYTAELGSETSQDEYRLTGAVVTDLEFGFDALTGPGAHPWKFTATLVGVDLGQNALTAALAAATTPETIEGHLSTISEGATSTAFGSLSEIASSLVQYRCRISGGRPYRYYGGTSDIPVGFGITKPDITVEAMVRVNATTKSNIYDIYNTASAVAGERRWRISVAGSSSRVFRVDHRLRFDSVKRGERDGEAVYMIRAHAVKDPTLASALQAVVVNHITGPLA